MNRKEALLKLAGSTLLTSAPLLGLASAPGVAARSTSTYQEGFLRRWQAAKEYSLKVLDKMPEELLDFRPRPEEMSFGRQFTHAAHWNTFFIGTIVNQPPLKEPAEVSKVIIREYYSTCHDHCAAIIAKLDDRQLDQTGYGTQPYWQKHTGHDFLLRAFMHTAHHRAQTLVYLRLKGIEPPFFAF